MPLAPNTLPARAYQRSTRTSRLLFHWRASDLSLTPVTGETPTFVRATGGGLVLDSRGYLRDVAQAQPRWDMGGYDAASGLWLTPGLRLEGQRTNRVQYSQGAFATQWTLTGTGTVTEDALVLGKLKLCLLNDTDAAAATNLAEDILTLVGDGVKAFSVSVKQGTSAKNSIKVIEAVTGNVLNALITWTAGVPAVAIVGGIGVYRGAELLGSGAYRLFFQTAVCSAAAAWHSVNLFATDAAVAADTGSTYFGLAQLEDAAFPSSMIVTGAAAVTRAADALSYPFLPPPQVMTFYAKFIEHGVVASGNRVLRICPAAPAGPQLLFDAVGAGYRIYHDNGAAAVSATSASFPNIGDTVELCGVLNADGSVYIGQSFNGGAEVVTAASGANGLASAWAASSKLWISEASAGTDPAYISVRSMKVAAGVRTMEYMRSAF